jgi:hypothetical protein
MIEILREPLSKPNNLRLKPSRRNQPFGTHHNSSAGNVRDPGPSACSGAAMRRALAQFVGLLRIGRNRKMRKYGKSFVAKTSGTFDPAGGML